jgi:hypothetical protein
VLSSLAEIEQVAESVDASSATGFDGGETNGHGNGAAPAETVESVPGDSQKNLPV